MAGILDSNFATSQSDSGYDTISEGLSVTVNGTIQMMQVSEIEAVAAVQFYPGYDACNIHQYWFGDGYWFSIQSIEYCNAVNLINKRSSGVRSHCVYTRFNLTREFSDLFNKKCMTQIFIGVQSSIVEKNEYEAAVI